MSTKDDILNLLSQVHRGGIDKLIDWLENQSDYFTAPSSTKYHGNYDGGLAEHSLNVYDSLVLLHDEYLDKADRYAEDTLIVVGLLHDLCKCNYYVKDEDPATDPQIRYMKDLIDKSNKPEPVLEKHRTKAHVSKVIEFYKNGEVGEFPQFTNSYKVKDEMPLGHGEKSLYIIQSLLSTVTYDEALAIRWHLGGFDPGFHFGFPSGWAAQQAVREIPLVPLLISADFMATWLVDATIK